MTAPYQVSIAVDAVIEALGAFLQPFVGSDPIVRGQQNRVPMPHDSFVLLTEILTVALETPTVSLQGTQINILSPARIDIQIDFYGPLASDKSKAVAGVYRTSYACSQFPDGIAPLYGSDAHQGALTNAEQQYEDRWTVTASLQFNPAVYIPQQSATQLQLNSVEDIL